MAIDTDASAPPHGACAHGTVKLHHDTRGNQVRAWWACGTCGVPFAPVARPGQGNGASAPVDPTEGKEYLSLHELAARIPYTEGTIRNLMTAGRLKLGTHYVKPHRRLAFRWSAMKAWLEGEG